MVKAYMGFMDHSPTEQFLGEPSLWHTTVLLLSEGKECSDLAEAIAAIINPISKRLKKWSQAKGGKYRGKFAQTLKAKLPGSGVMILATSAREQTMGSNKVMLIRELDLNGRYREEVQTKGKVKARIGPFTDLRTRENHFFELAENRALMILWIAHFTCRMHSYLADELKKAFPDLVSVDWLPIFIDKFAGDNVHAHPSMQLFQALVTHQILRTGKGNIRVAFFHDKAPDEANHLVDNIAGLFNELKNSPASYRNFLGVLGSGNIYWESGK